MKVFFKKIFSTFLVILLVFSQVSFNALLGTIAYADDSFDLFEITGVTVTSPNTAYVGGNVNINWTTTPVEDPETVNIYYCIGSGCVLGPGTNVTLISSGEVNDGVFVWDSTSVANGSQYRIYVARSNNIVIGNYSPEFEVYNFDYSDGEGDYSNYVGIIDSSPIWANSSYPVNAYATDQVSWSGYLWTKNSGTGNLVFTNSTGLSTNVSADTEGSYVVRFTATDHAGNIAYDQITFNRDTTAPTSSDNVQSGWYINSATITLTCDDGSGVGCERVYYTTNGTDPTTNSSYVDAGDSWQFTMSSEGTHTLKYRGEDELGNLEAVNTAENTIKIENNWWYVEVNKDSPSYENGTFSASASVYDGPQSGIASRVWSQQSGPGTITFSATGSSSTNVTASQEGVYVIRHTVNSVSNGSDRDSFTLYRDTTAPTSSDNVPSGRQQSNVDVTFSCNDTGTGASGCERVYYTTNGTDPTTSSSYVDSSDAWERTFSSEGEFTIKYRAEDRAGNLQAVQTASNTLQIDSTDPDLDWDEMDRDGEVDGLPLLYAANPFDDQGYGVSIDISTSDDASGVDTCEWTVESATVRSGENYREYVDFDDEFVDPCSSITIRASYGDIYTIRVTVTDVAGNSTYEEFILHRDNAIPTIENLNVTVQAHDVIHAAGWAHNVGNIGSFYPVGNVAAVGYSIVSWNDGIFIEEPLLSGTMILNTPNSPSTNFHQNIDISSLATGTYTMRVYATNEAGTDSWSSPEGLVSQSFTKTSDPVDLSGPVFVSSTPHNAQTHVSVASGYAFITFDKEVYGNRGEGCFFGVDSVGDYTIFEGDDCAIDIINVATNESVLNYVDLDRENSDYNTVVISYNQLEYNTSYRIMLPAGTILAGNFDNPNPTTTDINIYFTTEPNPNPADNTPPVFVSSTPHNAATHVSVASGVALITFSEDIMGNFNNGCYFGVADAGDFTTLEGDDCEIDIINVASNQSVLNDIDVDRENYNNDTLAISYNTLNYNTSYRIFIPAGSILDMNENPTTTDINIYFTTQEGTAPDITSLGISNLGGTYANIFLTSDQISPYPNIEYRISTVAYSGEWTAINVGGGYSISSNTHNKFLQNLALGTTYYYQVRLTHQGKTTVSVPMSFRTANAENGIVVHSVQRVLHGNQVMANNNYDNGYHFRFFVTVNNLNEGMIDFRLDDWSRVDGETMSIANNAKVIVSANGVSDHSLASTVLTNTSYTEIADAYTMDSDPFVGGRQLYIDVFYKIPEGSQGVYSTSYGIRARDND